MDYVAGDMSTGKMPPMLTSVKAPKKHEAHTSNGVGVKGVDDVLVRLSRCCNPVPGDEILGFVTRGRGVDVYKRQSFGRTRCRLCVQCARVKARWGR